MKVEAEAGELALARLEQCALVGEVAREQDVAFDDRPERGQRLAHERTRRCRLARLRTSDEHAEPRLRGSERHPDLLASAASRLPLAGEQRPSQLAR